MPHGAKPSKAQTGWAKGRHRKCKHPSGQKGHGKAVDKPKCHQLDIQSQILILQWKKAAEKVLGRGADLGWTVLGCASDPAQGTWDWWWQEARGVRWLLR